MSDTRITLQEFRDDIMLRIENFLKHTYTQGFDAIAENSSNTILTLIKIYDKLEYIDIRRLRSLNRGE